MRQIQRSKLANLGSGNDFGMFKGYALTLNRVSELEHGLRITNEARYTKNNHVDITKTEIRTSLGGRRNARLIMGPQRRPKQKLKSRGMDMK